MSKLSSNFLNSILDEIDNCDASQVAAIYHIIGNTHIDYNEHQIAISYLDKSNEIEQNYETLVSLSLAHENSMNYGLSLEFLSSAIEIANADDIDDSKVEQWIVKSKVLGKLAKNHFNINLIPEDRHILLSMLKTGDFHFRELRKSTNNRTMDASAPFQSYFKAFERLLHDEILLPFHAYMDSNQSHDLQKLLKSKSRSDRVLRNTFSNGKSLSPGQWRVIFDTGNVKFHEYLINFIKWNFSDSLVQELQITCNMDFELEDKLRFDLLRNSLSHTEIIDFSDLEKNRCKFVISFNKILELIFVN